MNRKSRKVETAKSRKWRALSSQLSALSQAQIGHRKSAKAGRRPAFTLIEMLVAIAILLAIMAMVGMVFQTAGKSSGQAQATSAVYRQLRNAFSQLRRDLDGCRPGGEDNSHAMLAIGGVEALAFATQKDMEGRTAASLQLASDLHRADVLTFTTDRDIQTYVFTQPSPSIPLDSTSLVTYGHADIGQLDTAFPYTFNTTIPYQRIESASKAPYTTPGETYYYSDMPASTWHVARRILRFPAITLNGAQLALGGVGPKTGVTNFANPEILQGAVDLFSQPFSVGTQYGSGLYRFADNVFDYGVFTYIDSATNQRARYRFEGGTGYGFLGDYWYADGGSGGVACTGAQPSSWHSWQRKVAGSPDPSVCGPYPAASAFTTLADMPNWSFRAIDSSKPLELRRTLLDPNAPVGAAERMGAYFLPHCSDFLVEYTYDDPAELLLALDGSGNWRAEPQAPIRWQRVPNGQQIVWSRLSVRPKNYSSPGDPRNQTDPIRWPRALRITMRGWGPGTTLESPIEQVIVHTFQ